MSADNYIEVRKDGRKWFVWHGFASDECDCIPPDAASFRTKGEALEYATVLYQSYPVVEYGICVS